MDASQIILIVVIGILLIAYPILVTTRNKKENQKLQEQTNSLKRGDKVLTTSGVYGTVVDLQMDNDKKIVTIETGSGNKKSYLAVDAYAIYTVLNEPKPEAKPEEKKPEDKKPEQKAEAKPEAQAKEAEKVEVKPQTPAEAEKAEPQKAKRSRKK